MDVMRHRSIKCSLILNVLEHATMCHMCSTIKANSFYKTLQNKPVEYQESKTKKTKRESFMTPEELHEKLQEEKRRRVNAERREINAKEKIKTGSMAFQKDDHDDFKDMFDKIDQTSLDPDMKIFWEVQRDILSIPNPKGYRWHPKIIRLCLSIWSRSPEVYNQLKESGMLKLPSGRLLALYKNSVSQRPGLNDDVLEWLLREADKLKLDVFGREGGIILDEMSIQEDLQLKTVDGVSTLVGLVSLGKEDEMMNCVNKCINKAELATHVLQFVFLGNTGFRFPFAHWPTKEVGASTLHILFWKAVYWLLKGGISITYCCCDGGEANRGFVKLHFGGKDPATADFMTRNPYTGGKMLFIMDFPHNMKKLRNNIYKSIPGGTRNLTLGNKPIAWKQWIDAFKWDQQTNTLPYHHRLTTKHFELGYASKMRNHLAEQVLNSDMLKLMRAFQASLSTSGHALDKTIEFLETSSTLIKNFTSPLPYTSLADPRFVENDRCLQWLADWGKEVKGNTAIGSVKERDKLFISSKTMFDISSCIVGFREFCKICFVNHPGCSVYAHRLNSNIVENVFCQQRGRNGQNDNPTYSQYCPTMNSILLGQTTTTKKSNTGKVDNLTFFKPNKLPVQRRKR